MGDGFDDSNRDRPRFERTSKIDSDDCAPAFSEEALALRFAERYEGNLRYVAAWNKWLRYDGKRWKFDDTLYALNLARKICREAASQSESSKTATMLASAKTVAAIERLVKADRRLAATVDQWDTDLWLLNTPGGVVDLRTSSVRPHSAKDYMTKICAVAPQGGCPRWLRHLDRITNGDSDLVSYLQRAFGYALTGSIREHALFFGYGTGANGKGVTVGTVASILADYHVTSTIEVFTASNLDRHPTELASLRGARLVSANETESGRRWAESRIKTLTGGDRVSARFMRQDFFEFQPQLKLFIFGNHKSSLSSVDEAIRRRFHLVPFTVTIPSEERDLDLAHKLREEWQGILAWMIEGCLIWQAGGLNPPEPIRSATAAYLDAEDLFAQWAEDECDVEAGNEYKWDTVEVLFASWSDYAIRAGEMPGSKKAFSQSMSEKFPPGRTKLGGRQHRIFRGIRKRLQEEQ